jgi:hypothetical protein
MSNKLQQQVWNHAPYTGRKLLALLAIAEWANDQGYCAISPEALAGRLRITGDSAMTVLGSLITEGDLSLIVVGQRYGIPDIYQLRTDNWNGEVQSQTPDKPQKSGFAQFFPTDSPVDR